MSMYRHLNNKMKVAIVAIAKNENNYINEWIDWHLGIGVDHIYVCDNNDTEKININNDKVDIINYRGKKKVQPFAYTALFARFKRNYDWIAFIDIDEFIVVEKGDIKEFLNRFCDVDIVRLCWRLYDGGNEVDIKGDDWSVMKRFTREFRSKENCYGKSIINCKIRWMGGWIRGHGYFKDNLIVVNARGEKCKNKDMIIGDTPIWEGAWINHYPTKTIGEFIRQKYWRGGPNGNDSKYKSLNYFFRYNPYNADIEKYGKEKTTQ